MAKNSFFDPTGMFAGEGGPLSSTPLGGFFYDPTEDNEAALQGVQQMRDAYGNLQTPDYQPVNYVGPEEAYDINFNPAETSLVDGTDYNNIRIDPQYRGEQIAQLNALKQLRDNGGLNLTDKANLAQIANDESAREQGQRGAIMQNAQMRGMGGSNLSILNQLNSAQASANRQSQRDMQIAGMAQDRALQAGNSAAGLAGQMSDRDFAQQAQVSQARDLANKFNAQMSNQGAQFNATGNLNAQKANQDKSQQVNNLRAVAKNSTQEMNNYRMPTQAFQNAATKANGLADAGKAQTQYFGQKAAGNQAAQGGMWGSLMQLGGALGSSALSNKGGGQTSPYSGPPSNMNGEQPQWNATNGSSGSSNYDLNLPDSPSTPESNYNNSGDGDINAPQLNAIDDMRNRRQYYGDA